MSKNKTTRDFKYLSESVIARAAIPFLRTYYKYRENLMETDLEAGVSFNIEYGKKVDNITIDGLLSYKQKNGGLFSVAVEATSKDKREEEVFFKVQNTLLNLDATAVGITVVTILFSILYISKLINLRLLGWSIPVVAIIFFISAFILIYRWLFTYIFPFVDRYHYIQAVEQFKQYQANEQWIAVGADVFESKNTPQLLELKDQCVKSGFGLMEVTEDLVVSIIIAPARNTLFKKRQELEVEFTTEIAQRLGKNYFLKIRDAVLKNNRINSKNFINVKKRIAKNSYFIKAGQIWNKKNRVEIANFRKSYYSQIIISLLGFSIMGAILWKELSEPDVLQMSMEEYLTELDKIKYDLWKAPELTPEDTLDQLYVQSFMKVENDYINTPEDQPLFFLRKKEKKSFFIFQSPEPTVQENLLKEKNQVDGLFIVSEGVIQAEYPCERVIETNKVFYAIQQSIHKTLVEAMDQIDSISSLNLSTNIFWLGCLNIKNDSFIVIFNQMYDDQELAALNLINIQDRLEKEKKDTKNIKIRILLKREED